MFGLWDNLTGIFEKEQRVPVELSLGPISHIEHWAKLKPDDIAIAGPSLSMSWKQLLESVLQVAGQLEGQAVKGSVLVAAQGEFERIYALACTYLGLASASLPAGLTHSELADLGFSTIVTADTGLSSEFLKVAKVSPIAGSSPTVQSHKWQAGEIYKFVFSSGTTGKPKAAIFPFEVSNARVMAASAHYMRQSPFFTVVGLSTTAGNTCMFLDLWRGSTNLVPGQVAANVALAKRYRPKGIMGSPTNLEGFAKELAKSTSGDVEIEEAVSAGSFITQKLAASVAQLLGCKVTNVYGSTEAGLIAFSDATLDESAGLELYPGVQVTVVDGLGQALPSGEAGQLLVQNPYTIPGYLLDQSQESFVEGQFRSGDLGYLDDRGKLQLAGREDDLINLSGLKIDPRPIEQHVIEKFGFQEAASMLATNQHGKQFHIMLVASDAPVDENAVRDYLFSVYRTSAPQRIQALNKLPRNEMGKVPRKILIQTPE